MNAENFIEINYHSRKGLAIDKLIEDKTGKEVSFEEIAEAYHEAKLKFLNIGNVTHRCQLKPYGEEMMCIKCGYITFVDNNRTTQQIIDKMIIDGYPSPKCSNGG